MQPVVGLAVRVAVAAAVLAVLFHFVPTGAVLATLGALDPAYLAAGILLQFGLRAVATLRIKVVTDSQSMDLSHSALWRILLTTHFYSMLLPGPLGGGGATWIKYVRHGATHSAAAAAILLNRGVALLVMLSVGSFAWLVDSGRARLWPAAALSSAGLLALVLTRGRRAPPRVPPQTAPRSRFTRWTGELIRRLLLFSRIPGRGKLLLLTSSVLFELVGAVAIWCFAMAIGLELRLLTTMWIWTGLHLVLLLPLSIAGLGLREAGLVGLCALIGVPSATAVAWSLTIFFGSLIVAAVGGLIESRSVADRVLRLGGPRRKGDGARKPGAVG